MACPWGFLSLRDAAFEFGGVANANFGKLRIYIETIRSLW